MGSDHAREVAHAFEAGRQSVMNGPLGSPRKQLTVAQITELSKAGVTVDLNDVEVVEPPKEDRFWPSTHHLMVPLMYRIHQAFPLSPMRQDRYKFNYMAVAPIKDEKIAVMVVTAHGNSALIEDDARMFPSDAFIAKLILMVETEERSSANHPGAEATQTGGMSGGYANAPSTSPPSGIGRQGLLSGVGGQQASPRY